MLGNTLQEQQLGYLTLRIHKDKDGWANDLLRRGRLTMRITCVPEGYRLRGFELEAQTLTLLYKLADYGVRAKLLLSFGCLVLELEFSDEDGVRYKIVIVTFQLQRYDPVTREWRKVEDYGLETPLSFLGVKRWSVRLTII